MTTKIFEESDGVCLVRGSTDEQRIKLFLDAEVLSQKGEITVGRLENLIRKHIPLELLDKGVLRDIAKTLPDEIKIEKRRIVKGSPPTKGKDGKLLFLKRKLSRTPTLEVTDKVGSVSLYELGLFENIYTNEIVARVYPPKEGIPGTDIFGKDIAAAPGDPAKVEIDSETLERRDNKTEEENYDTIISKVDGYLEQQGDKLLMREVFVVPSDLDVEYGNIHFIGEVEVKGDVLAGFNIEAEKGLVISGNVNKAELFSKTGDIEIKGRFFGEDEGRIIGGRSVKVRSIQDARVDCVGDFYSAEEIRNAQIRTQGTVQTPNGSMLGGHLYSVYGGNFGELGTEDDVPTHLTLGSSVEISEEYMKLLVRIEQHEEGIKLLDAHLGPYAKNPDRIQLLDEDLQEKLKALLEKKTQLKKSHENLVDKKDNLLSAVEWEDKVCVAIKKSVFPGARISVGEVVYEVKDARQGPITIVYDSEKEEFLEEEYQEVSPLMEDEDE